jgi:NADH-quinone oxidoreductase subunit M
MFNHGIITGGMFLLVGVIYSRAHTRDLDKFGGLGTRMPLYSGMLMVFTFASLGLPGLSGFVSEFLSLLGSFGTYKVVTAVASIGLVLTAAYFLTMLQRMLLGKLNEKWAGLPDMNSLEFVTLIPLLAIIAIIGVYPLSILKYQTPAIIELVKKMGGVLR